MEHILDYAFNKTKFRHGQIVRKKSGAEWEGKVVGAYSTEHNPKGYGVESSAHKASVQIYPEAALEMAPAKPFIQE